MDIEKLRAVADKISRFNSQKLQVVGITFGIVGLFLSTLDGTTFFWFSIGFVFLASFLIFSRRFRSTFARKPFRSLTILLVVYINEIGLVYPWLYFTLIFVVFSGFFFPTILRGIAFIIEYRRDPY